MSLPDWLLQRLRDENPDGAYRGARLDRCDHCGARTLRGLDDERCAIATECTPISLDHTGEYLALAQGLRTYTLARRTNASGRPRWEIDPRTRWHIQRFDRRYPVIPAHHCTIRLPAAPGTPFRHLAPRADHNECPF